MTVNPKSVSKPDKKNQSQQDDLSHQVKDSLRQSEEKYRSIIENMQEPYYETDLEGKLTFVNDALCSRLGYSREELIGKNINRENTDEENAKKIYQAYNRIYRTGEPGKGIEETYIRKDGIKGFAELSVSLIRDTEGKPIGFRGTSHDITERKQMEESIRQSEEKYRTFIETIQDGYFEIDLSGRFTFVNDVICQHLRYSKEELIGMNNRQYQTEANAKKAIKAFTEVLTTGKPIKAYEMEVIRKDDTIQISEVSISLIRNTEGKPITFRGTSRDITERKRMEEALRQSEEKYRTILETIQEGYFELDLAGNFTYVNDAECANLGYSREELIGMNYKQYSDEKNAKSLYHLFVGIYKTGIPVKIYDLELIKKDGTKSSP